MTDRAVEELEAVKHLLVLLLMRLGASPDEIGLALDLTGRRVRQIVPSKKVERFAFVKPE